MSVVPINPLGWIPESFKQQILDAILDLLVSTAEKTIGNEVGDLLKKLKSDAGLQDAVDRGLTRAVERFVDQYGEIDKEMADRLSANPDFWKDPDTRAAILDLIRHPGYWKQEELDAVAKTFKISPYEVNSERVTEAVSFFLRCVLEEVWHRAEFQPIYLVHQGQASLETLENIAVELRGLRSDTQQTLLLFLQLVVVQQKLLAAVTRPELKGPARVWHNIDQERYIEFIGRETEIQKLHELLSRRHRGWVITIDGVGGVGKTALAQAVAWHYIDSFDSLPESERFDAVVWVSAKSGELEIDGVVPRYRVTRTLDEIYSAISDTLVRQSISRAPTDEQDMQVSDALKRNRTLLVIDNYEAVDDERVAAFLRELPSPTKCIVTTRHRLDVAYPIRLSEMDRNDAMELIHYECSKKAVALTETEAERLFQGTGGNPLAIVLLVGMIGQGYTPEAVLTRLGNAEGPVARYILHWELERIHDKPAMILLQALSQFPADATREALGVVTQLSPDPRDEGLVHLERASLVNRTGNRFSLPSLLKSWISAGLSTDDALRFRVQCIGWMLKLTEADAEGQWPKCSQIKLERDNIYGLIDLAISEGLVVEAITAIRHIDHCLWGLGYWNDLVRYLQVGIEIARTQNDVRSLGIFERHLGDIFRFQGRIAEAEDILGQALTHFVEIGDRVRSLTVQRSLGRVLTVKQEYGRAMEVLESCLKEARNLEFDKPEHKHGTIAHLQNNLTEIDLHQKNWESAASRLAESIGLGEMYGITIALVAGYRLRGRLVFAQQHIPEAKEDFARSLELAERFDLLQDQAYGRRWLARVALAYSDQTEAERQARLAADIFERLGMSADVSKVESLMAGTPITIGPEPEVDREHLLGGSQ